jgi:hypothetical protein
MALKFASRHQSVTVRSKEGFDEAAMNLPLPSSKNSVC